MPIDQVLDDAERGRWRTTTRATTGLAGERDGLKYGTTGGHTVHSDEPAGLGGAGAEPTPLGYFALAAGWCVLSQLLRYARVRKVDIVDATCEVEIDWSLTGSVRVGDIAASCDEVRYQITVSSPSPTGDVEAVVALARQGCFVEQALRNTTTTTSTLDITTRGDATR